MERYWWEGYVCKGIGRRFMGKGGDGWKGRGIIGGRVMCVRGWVGGICGMEGMSGKVWEMEGYHWWEGYVYKGIGGRFMGKGGDGWKSMGKGGVLLVGWLCV